MTPPGVCISRNHFLHCGALHLDLFDTLPPAPPGVHRIDHALNCLPDKASAGPPGYWSVLLQLLYAIDCLVHPLATATFWRITPVLAWCKTVDIF